MTSLVLKPVAVGVTLFAMVALSTHAMQAVDGAAPTEPASKPQQKTDEPPPQEAPLSPIMLLLKEIDQLRAEVLVLRQALAAADLDATEARRELEELRQFIADNRQYGDDFEQYRAVKEIAEREDRRREAEANRARREVEKAQREARSEAARLEKARRDAASLQMAKYRRAGFTPLGLDVYTSRMGFFYAARDNPTTRYDYVPELGATYLRAYPGAATDIDYSTMTISGSVLNASAQVRNIGIAITFFDESGNQVGHETVQINNARPDVPYPFTSKIDMALNRPFESSSTYVLYADAVEEAE